MEFFDWLNIIGVRLVIAGEISSTNPHINVTMKKNHNNGCVAVNLGNRLGSGGTIFGRSTSCNLEEAIVNLLEECKGKPVMFGESDYDFPDNLKHSSGKRFLKVK